MQGLNGYTQGRDKRRAQDMQDTEITRDEQRRQEDLAIRREMQAAQVEQMRAAREERERQAAREMQMDRRTAADRGEAPVEQVRAAGTNMAGAFGGGNALADVGTKAMGGMMAQQAKTPTYEIGGTGYVKAGPSLAERSAEMQAKQRSAEQNAAQIARQGERAEDRAARQGERAEDRAFTMQRDAANQKATMAEIGARVAAQPTPRAQLPTEGERKAAALFGVAQNGYDTLEKLITASVDPKTGERTYKAPPSLMDKARGAVGMGVGNVLTRDEYRQMGQAAQQMADMWLRYTSGAAVPETEVQRYALTFTPLPGDDPGTLKQKAEARRRVIGSLQQAAGRALQVPGHMGTAPSFPDVSNDRPPLDSFMVRR